MHKQQSNKSTKIFLLNFTNLLPVLHFASHLLMWHLPDPDIQAIHTTVFCLSTHVHARTHRKQATGNVTDSKADRRECCWVFIEVTSATPPADQRRCCAKQAGLRVRRREERHQGVHGKRRLDLERKFLVYVAL